MNTKKIILLFSFIASSLQGMGLGNNDLAIIDTEFQTWFNRTNHLIAPGHYENALKNLIKLETEIVLNPSITADHLILYDKTVRSIQMSSQHMLIDIQLIPNFIKKIHNHALFVSLAIKEKKKLIKKADEEAKQWLQKKIYSSHDYTTQDLKRFCVQLKSLTIMLSRNFCKDKPEDPKTLISWLHPADPSKKFDFSKAVQKSSDIPTFIRTTFQQIQHYTSNLEATQKNIEILNDLR